MWPFTKKKKPQRRMFAGASVGRLTADWIAGGTSADAEINSSLVRLRNRSRQLIRDNDYCQSAMRTFQNNVIGEGVGCQSQVRMKRGGKLDKRLNDLIEMAWYRWQRKETCDVAGKLSLQEIARLVIGSNFESGEILIRMVPMRFGGSKIPLALEVIEADLLDEGYNEKLASGNVVKMGVELNSWKRPVAYHFKTAHPGDIATAMESHSLTRRRVPAEEILHLFVTRRANQTRGIPWLHSTISRLHHMQGYEEAEVIAARASAAIMGFIESPEGEPSLKDDVDNGQSVTEFEPGVFKALNPGEKVSVPTVSRPGGQFDPFMRLMLRGVAAGVGASYESVSKDFSQSNYSSSRLALLDDRDHWRVLQAWMVNNFYQPIFERFLWSAVVSGAVSISDFEINADTYLYPKWKPRGWSWIDPQKEVEAYKTAVRSGFKTLSDVVADSGGDLDELLTQREQEIKLADDLGIVFDTDPKYVSNAGLTQARPQGTALPDTDPSADPAKPDPNPSPAE